MPPLKILSLNKGKQRYLVNRCSKVYVLRRELALIVTLI